MRMQPEAALARARRAQAVVALLLGTLALAGCASLMSNQRPPTPPPVVSPTATSSTVLNEDLLLLQKLVQGRPSEQAEIVASVQRDYDMAPTPSHTLKLALIPGHQSHPLPGAAARAHGEPGDAAPRRTGARFSAAFAN